METFQFPGVPAMRRCLAGLFGICLALVATSVATPVPARDMAAQPAAGPQGPEQGELRRQPWLVPSQDRSVLMRTMLFRPAGAGPFPLVVISHGSVQNAEQRVKFAQPVFVSAAAFFVARGYAVAVPQRPGHGAAGGPYLEAQGPCENADYAGSGQAVAGSIEAAIAYLTRQRFIRREGVIVAGQSAGGWGALAFASRNPKNVAAIINFAGGRGGRVHGRADNNCAPDRLVDAAAAFGASARVPVLSIYAQNDSYFSARLSRRIADAYRSRGGRMDYRLLPAFGADGHHLFPSTEGVAVWGPVVDAFLKSLR
jgi:dienelactone hydrolase